MSPHLPDQVAGDVAGEVVGGAAPRRAIVLTGLAVLFLGGWGPALLDAFTYLQHRQVLEALTPSRDLHLAVQDLTTGALLIGAALLLAQRCGVRPAQLGLSRPRNLQEWGREAAMFTACLLLLALTLAVSPVLGQALGWPAGGYPRPAEPTGWYWARSLVSSALAGPTEEIVLLAVTVALLRRLRVGWTTVLVTVVVLRVSFHAFYGPSALVMVLWAGGVVLAYRHLGCVLGAVVAHSLWDVADDLREIFGSSAPQLVLMATVAPCLVLMVKSKIFSRHTELGLLDRQLHLDTQRRRSGAPTGRAAVVSA